MSYKFDATLIERLMRDSRDDTRRLFDLVVSESDLRRPPSAGFRPILWHLGHIGAFEEYWLLQRVIGDPPISNRYSAIFDPIKTPREDSTNLPPIVEIEGYIGRVREEALALLGRIRPDEKDPLLRNGYVFDMVIEHEYQHQETLAYLLQMLDPELKRRPDLSEYASNASHESRAGTVDTIEDMVAVEAGPFEMGSTGYPFAYDNEQPLHTAVTGDYRIDRYPVTNASFARFIEAGGYQTRSLWSDEGWAWKEENNIVCPLYWTRSNDKIGDERWIVQEMFEREEPRPEHPVTGVSWHEASAYAKFAGKRLPTEAEWEKAASWDPRTLKKRRFSWGDEEARPDLANFHNHRWGTSPVSAFPAGRSAYGCFDMTGNVWEWTSSPFGPFKGFQAFPYPEYSELWFDGDHRVLKGGSWTTCKPLLRCSFRNFFRPRFRAAFAGFRCAAD